MLPSIPQPNYVPIPGMQPTGAPGGGPFMPPALPSMNTYTLPPLPPGWTEHVGPGSVPYYHHSASQQSTYVRPLPSFLDPQAAASADSDTPKKKKKKEKPLLKVPIGGTPWTRVTTTEGNVFYTHKERKESVWEVPEEIREEVEAFERQEALKKQAEEQEQEQRKRKLEDSADGEMKKPKRVKLSPEVDQDALASQMVDAFEEDENDEELEKEAEAARAVWEKEEEEKKKAEEKERKEKEKSEAEEAAEKAKAAAPPNMSIEEARALFKNLLEDLRISHLAPYEDSLPLIVPDPRYALLPSANDRMAVFNEYCRELAHKARPAAGAARVKKNAEDEFMKLLREDVTSTRAGWNDWRKKWKKDRRFFGWGTEKEREGRFREWVRALGERKRADKEQAEKNFMELLRETKSVVADANWSDIKRLISSDPRYDAVGSSTLREELFTSYTKKLASTAALASDPKLESKLEKQQRALKERETKVQQEKGRLERVVNEVRGEVGMEEAEMQFNSLLTDAVRDPHATWESSLRAFTTDPRFTASPLQPSRMRALFSAYIANLVSKYTTALHTLFLAHAPGLSTPFSALPDSLLNSLPATKLELSRRALEHAYTTWQAQRLADAKKAFSEMLDENSFVSFWGRARKLAQNEVAQGVLEADITVGDDEEGEDQQVDSDLRAKAGEVGVQQVEAVLKGDSRYRVFDHIPQEREHWIKDYLMRLTAPKMSVHAPDAA